MKTKFQFTTFKKYYLMKKPLSNMKTINAYFVLLFVRRKAYAKKSAARPDPSMMTTGMFRCTVSLTVFIVFIPPSTTMRTVGTLMPIVIEQLR